MSAPYHCLVSGLVGPTPPLCGLIPSVACERGLPSVRPIVRVWLLFASRKSSFYFLERAPPPRKSQIASGPLISLHSSVAHMPYRTAPWISTAGFLLSQGFPPTDTFYSDPQSLLSWFPQWDHADVCGVLSLWPPSISMAPPDLCSLPVSTTLLG